VEREVRGVAVCAVSTVKGTLRIAGLRNAALSAGGGRRGEEEEEEGRTVQVQLAIVGGYARARVRHPFVNSSRCREAGSFSPDGAERSSRGCFDGTPLLLRGDSRVAAALRVNRHARETTRALYARRIALRDTRALSIPVHCLRRTMQFIVIGHERDSAPECTPMNEASRR